MAEGKPDDFASMREVMTRRFSNREEKNWPDPDLIIIDGGKGQLSSAVEALKALDIVDQDIISLAKKFEEVFVPERSKPIVIERDHLALFLLQQVRDEAHRFAITKHRARRQKAQIKSIYDDLPGIGPKKRQILQSTYPRWEDFLAAPEDVIAQQIKLPLETIKILKSQIKP